MNAPHKIKVPLGTPWPAERRNIQEGYPLFPKYVQNKTNPWDDQESFYLYEYNWNLLPYRDMERGEFYDSDQTEIIVNPFPWTTVTDFGHYATLELNVPAGILKVGDRIVISGGKSDQKDYNGDRKIQVQNLGWSYTYVTETTKNEDSWTVEFTMSQDGFDKLGNGFRIIGNGIKINSIVVNP